MTRENQLTLARHKVHEGRQSRKNDRVIAEKDKIERKKKKEGKGPRERMERYVTRMKEGGIMKSVCMYVHLWCICGACMVHVWCMCGACVVHVCVHVCDAFSFLFIFIVAFDADQGWCRSFPNPIRV